LLLATQPNGEPLLVPVFHAPATPPATDEGGRPATYHFLSLSLSLSLIPRIHSYTYTNPVLFDANDKPATDGNGLARTLDVEPNANQSTLPPSDRRRFYNEYTVHNHKQQTTHDSSSPTYRKPKQ
jgi:hypothetical protein